MTKIYQHWNFIVDDKNIAWLGFDKKDAVVNTIDWEVLTELSEILQECSQNSNKLAGLIIHSLKAKGYIAGADINTFSNFKTQKEILDFLKKGQEVFSALEALPINTVAMIDGFCLGGGLELSLACKWRIATDSSDTKLALPEVLLGFNPGWGGTVRLPRLIGGFSALSQVMLTGSFLSASKAKKLGVVDAVVPLRQLKRAAIQFVLSPPSRKNTGFMKFITQFKFVRSIFATLINRKLREKLIKDHYPAPYAMVDLWESEGALTEKAYVKEIETVDKLIHEHPTAANLIRIFKLKEQLKAFAKLSDFKVKHVHVIGAGTMGGDIASWCALKGFNVTLQDLSLTQLATARARAAKLYKKKLRKPHLVQAALDRLVMDVEGFGLAKADVIIEAVSENLVLKQKILKNVEEKASKHAIIATNTSSIPLAEIYSALKEPSRLVGIHFFNPVAKMELVEVVCTDIVDSKVLNDSFAFVSQIGRLPLPVKSSPGFLVNRVLMPYLMECMQLLQEGYSAELIDASAKEFGMMMGPVELADTVGLDICLAVAENLTEHFGGGIPDTLRNMVQQGDLGRKTGKGFYNYDKRGQKVAKSGVKAESNNKIAERLILRMVNEASACLREGIVENSDLLDAAMIFGTGFAPFRGGPMHYATQFGRDKLNQLFIELELQYGERFKADLGLALAME